MVHTDSRFAVAIEKAVGEIEAETDAELIVVAVPRSGSYRDVAHLCGIVAGVGVLAFLCWSPWIFDPLYFPLDVAGVAAIASWLAAWSGLAVRLAGETRRRRQVRECAEAAFVQEAAHATVGRTGVLVYLSAEEGRVELIPDHGLLGRVPGAEWNALGLTAADLASLLEGLQRLGVLLARHVPPTGDNPDEIANAPRVRA